MKSSVRVFGNTVVLYVKIVVSTLVGLYLTRVVLDVLGIEDFGIYNLIAGVIAVLAFVESALMISTQRYISIALGENNTEKVKKYISAGIIIHSIIALFIGLVLEICAAFIFDGFLNIPPDRIGVAKEIYQLMVFSTCFTILGVPFNAAIIAYEDIWFYGAVQILLTILKLGVIVGFSILNCDYLFLYSAWMVSTTIAGIIIAYLWCKYKYSTCRSLDYSWKNNILQIKEMLGFTGWHTLGAFAVVARNQGISVLLNVFFGPAVNGVFGIANQVDSQLISFANTLTLSMTPQIVKSQGQQDRQRLIFLSVFSSKLAFYLSAVLALPLIIEMPVVLNVWLKDVPAYTELYCTLILYLFLLCELNPGIIRGIQAVGRIKWQQIWCSICVIMPIPIGALMFVLGENHYTITYVMLIAQVCSIVVTIYWGHMLFGLKIGQYISFCIKSVMLFLCLLIAGQLLDAFLQNHIGVVARFVAIVVLSFVIFSSSYAFLCFNKEERSTIINLVRSIMKRK